MQTRMHIQVSWVHGLNMKGSWPECHADEPPIEHPTCFSEPQGDKLWVRTFIAATNQQKKNQKNEHSPGCFINPLDLWR